jgi:hypothetical protein
MFNRFLLFAPYHGDEVLTEGFSFLAGCREECLKQGITLAPQDKPYVLYYNVSDFEKKDKGFVSINSVYVNILHTSKVLDFNYDVLYKGREYFKRMDTVAFIELKEKIERQIKFVKPEYLLIPDTQFFYFNDYRILQRVLNEILIENKDLKYVCYSKYRNINDPNNIKYKEITDKTLGLVFDNSFYFDDLRKRRIIKQAKEI